MLKKALSPLLAGYELRFESLFHRGRALSFNCDGEGHVDMDAMSPQARGNYLYARAMVGREYSVPIVLACAEH